MKVPKRNYCFTICSTNGKKYKECLQLITKIRDEYKTKNLEMDLITHIQLYLKEAIILLAYGNYEKCEKSF